MASPFYTGNNRPWMSGPPQPRGPSLPFGGSMPFASPRGGWERPPIYVPPPLPLPPPTPTPPPPDPVPQLPPDWYNERPEWSMQPPPWYGEWGPSDPYNFRTQYPGIQDYNNSGAINTTDFNIWTREQQGPEWVRNLPDFDAMPEWMSQSGVGQARPDWLDEQYGPSDRYNLRSRYPGIQDYDNSGAINTDDYIVYAQEQAMLRDQRERPEWMSESGAGQARPDWLDEHYGPSDPNGLRAQYPGIQDYNNSGNINTDDYIVYAREQAMLRDQRERPEWLNEEFSPDRPDWLNESIDTTRPDWLDEQYGPSDPNGFRTQYPGIKDYNNSGNINTEDVITYGREQRMIAAQRERPEWMNEEFSPDRPSWLNETIDTTRPDWLDENAGASDPNGLRAQYPGIQDYNNSGTINTDDYIVYAREQAMLRDQRERPGWLNETIDTTRPDWLNETIDTTRPDWLDENAGASDPNGLRAQYPGIKDYNNSGTINTDDYVVYAREQAMLRDQRARPEWMNEEFSPDRPSWLNEEFAPERPSWLNESIDTTRPDWLDETIGPDDPNGLRAQYPGIKDYNNSGTINTDDYVVYAREQAMLRDQRERPDWLNESIDTTRPGWLDETVDSTAPDWYSRAPDWVNSLSDLYGSPEEPSWYSDAPEWMGRLEELASELGGLDLAHDAPDVSGAMDTWLASQDDPFGLEQSRPGWLDESIDTARPDWLDETVGPSDPYGLRAQYPGIQDYDSSGTINTADVISHGRVGDVLEAQRARPDWLNEDFAPARPDWLNEEFSPERPSWLNETIDTTRPGWLDENIGASDPHGYRAQYPGIKDYNNSGAINTEDIIVYSQEQAMLRDQRERPDWLNETIDTTRPDWLNEASAGQNRPGWLDQLSAGQDRPVWLDESIDTTRPGWLDETADFARPGWLDEAFNPSRPGWLDESIDTTRPDWLDESVGASDPNGLRAQYPGIKDYNNSGTINTTDVQVYYQEQAMLRDQRERPEWLNEEFSPDRPSWLNETIDTTRPGWLDEEFAPARPGWLNEEFAPARPDWLNEEFAPDRPNWLNESVDTTRPGWLDETVSTPRPGWLNDTIRTPRPSWLNETVSTPRPGWLDEASLGQGRPGWMDQAGASQTRPGWMNEDFSQLRPGWLDESIDTTRPDWLDETVGPSDPYGLRAQYPGIKDYNNSGTINTDDIVTHSQEQALIRAQRERPEWLNETYDTPEWYDEPPWYAWNFVPPQQLLLDRMGYGHKNQYLEPTYNPNGTIDFTPTGWTEQWANPGGFQYYGHPDDLGAYTTILPYGNQDDTMMGIQGAVLTPEQMRLAQEGYSTYYDPGYGTDQAWYPGMPGYPVNWDGGWGVDDPWQYGPGFMGYENFGGIPPLPSPGSW